MKKVEVEKKKMKKIYYDKITENRYSPEAIIKTFKNMIYGIENDAFTTLEVDIVEVEIYEEGDVSDHRAMKKYKKQGD